MGSLWDFYFPFSIFSKFSSLNLYCFWNLKRGPEVPPPCLCQLDLESLGEWFSGSQGEWFSAGGPGEDFPAQPCLSLWLGAAEMKSWQGGSPYVHYSPPECLLAPPSPAWGRPGSAETGERQGWFFFLLKYNLIYKWCVSFRCIAWWLQFISVQLLSRVRLFATPCAAAH